jgi:hypothetical protein
MDQEKEVMQESRDAHRAIWAQDIFLGKRSLDNLPEPYLILYDRESLDFSTVPGAINTIAREKGYQLVSITPSTHNMIQAIMEKI